MYSNKTTLNSCPFLWHANIQSLLRCKIIYKMDTRLRDAMIRALFFLCFVTYASAFTLTMCEVEPKRPAPLTLHRIKHEFPVVVKHRHELFNSSMDLQREKIFYVATFTKKGIVLRPQKIRLRPKKRNRVLAMAERVSKELRRLFNV